MQGFENPAVEAVFDAAPEPARSGMHQLRALIFAVARETPQIGPVTEALRWGQPAYLAPKGTTLRIGLPKSGGFALYAPCQSRVISSYASWFAGLDRIEGNRAVLFEHPEEIDAGRLRLLILHALQYHRADVSQDAIFSPEGRKRA